MLKDLDYYLVICEKPDAARRIAEAMGEPEELQLDGISIYVVKNSKYLPKIRNGAKDYVICSALGHLYTVDDPTGKRYVYPVFDLNWIPTYIAEKNKDGVKKRISVINKLAKNAKGFIHACDFDLEGETIGYNILKYACDGKENVALRAKFSTLTKDELRKAFEDAEIGLGGNLAEAGRARHIVDFLYGVNVSRALSESFYTANSKYRNVTIGRVQGPALAFVVNREIAIRTFVPTPYWTIIGEFEADGLRLVANYYKDRIDKLRDALDVKISCEGKIGLISKIKKTKVRFSPPTPFNTGDLQKEAYRVFGFSPSQTLRIAERLYLDALISYPRTSSQKLPTSIGYKRILKNLSLIQTYSKFCKELLLKELKPVQGKKDDPAHPAIYPTGELPKRELDEREKKIYDLIVRRFLAVFGDDAIRERVSAEISVNEHKFKLNGRRTVYEGWIKYYRPYTAIEDAPLPELKEGQELMVLSIVVNEKFEQHPPRYNQASLLDKMEKEGIGTKVTRSEIIRTLYDRGYVYGESMNASDVGFAVIESMRKFSPEIIKTEMTRSMERRLEDIELGKEESDYVIEEAINELMPILERIVNEEREIGKGIREAVVRTVRAQNLIGPCPICKVGVLTVIRSKRTKKRFVGCTNYSKGCRASAPLPQRGVIKSTNKTCEECGWPIIYVKLGKIPWKLCVNPNCVSKKKVTQVKAETKKV